MGFSCSEWVLASNIFFGLFFSSSWQAELCTVAICKIHCITSFGLSKGRCNTEAPQPAHLMLCWERNEQKTRCKARKPAMTGKSPATFLQHFCMDSVPSRTGSIPTWPELVRRKGAVLPGLDFHVDLLVWVDILVGVGSTSVLHCRGQMCPSVCVVLQIRVDHFTAFTLFVDAISGC